MDEALLLALNGLRSPGLDHWVKPLDEWGIYFFLFAAPLLLLLESARHRMGLFDSSWPRRDLRELARIARDGMLSWFLSIFVAENLIKGFIARPRPTAQAHLREALNVLGRVPSARSLSFPSGTATACFAVALFLWARLGPRVGIPLALLATLIGAARIYIGVHYPTDILAGAILGGGLGWLFARTGQRLDRPSLARAAVSVPSESSGAEEEE